MSLIENPGSYSIRNFIPFTDEVYFRLLERQFETWWPAHLLMLAAGASILVLVCLGKIRTVAAALALPFAACAVTFHFRLYAELTPVGKIFGWAFLAQIPLILIWGFASKARETFRPAVHTVTGAAIAAFGLAGYPALSLLTDRTWQGAAYFGMAPDPTICVFLGIALICARPTWLFLLLPIPLLWAFVTWGTLDSLGAPHALVLPIVSAMALAAGVWKTVTLRKHAPPRAA